MLFRRGLGRLLADGQKEHGRLRMARWPKVVFLSSFFSSVSSISLFFFFFLKKKNFAACTCVEKVVVCCQKAFQAARGITPGLVKSVILGGPSGRVFVGFLALYIA